MLSPDMEFVKNSTLPNFQAKNFTPSISSNFNSFSKKTQKMSENGEIYTAGKTFTLTAVTNSTSVEKNWPYQKSTKIPLIISR